MIRKIVLRLLTGKNYDVSAELFGDFPESRNFDVLILGGSKAYKRHGNYAYLGKVSGNKKVLSLCYPYRTSQNNMEILRMYHSYLKKGGHVIFYHDAQEDKLIGKQSYYNNIRILHKIQQQALGVKYSKLDFMRYLLNNHAQSWIARKYYNNHTIPRGSLIQKSSDTPNDDLANFCKVRGYTVSYIRSSHVG